MLGALPVVRGNAMHLGASAAFSAGTELRGCRQVGEGGGRRPAAVGPRGSAGSPQRLGRLLPGRSGPVLRERGRWRAAGALPAGAAGSAGGPTGRERGGRDPSVHRAGSGRFWRARRARCPVVLAKEGSSSAEVPRAGSGPREALPRARRNRSGSGVGWAGPPALAGSISLGAGSGFKRIFTIYAFSFTS